MGPAPEPRPRRGILANAPDGAIVYATATGANVVDVDGNRYVDLAAGFGSLLLGHGHPGVVRALELQSERLMQALGDVHPSQAKIALSQRLCELFPGSEARVILGQSGADAVTAALKTAVLATGRSGVIAFGGAYHGLSYAPLAACGLRTGYRTPFAEQLNPGVVFVDYPGSPSALASTLESVRRILAQGSVGAVLIEPILGRGGCVVPPAGFLPDLAVVTRQHGALLIADEIWTGLGRSGAWLSSVAQGASPDLICLGKGLGGGLPISACLGSVEVMNAWRREPEVVHTATFAGAPLACTTALATLDLLGRHGLVERSAAVGARWRARLAQAVAETREPVVVRGAGLMVGVDLGPRPGVAAVAQRALLERGYLVSTGGGGREVLVFTPPLNIAESLLEGMVEPLMDTLRALPFRGG